MNVILICRNCCKYLSIVMYIVLYSSQIMTASSTSITNSSSTNTIITLLSTLGYNSSNYNGDQTLNDTVSSVSSTPSSDVNYSQIASSSIFMPPPTMDTVTPPLQNWTCECWKDCNRMTVVSLNFFLLFYYFFYS